MAGAESVLLAAMRRADAHRAAFGAADVRAASAGLGVEAALLGPRLALEDGKPSKVLSWAERARSAAQRTRPVLPGTDARQRELLTQYRQVSDRIRGVIGGAALLSISITAMAALCANSVHPGKTDPLDESVTITRTPWHQVTHGTSESDPPRTSDMGGVDLPRPFLNRHRRSLR